MKYYIAEYGRPAGPFTPSELLLHGLTHESLVYNDVLSDWTMATNVVELAEILDAGKVGKNEDKEAKSKPQDTKTQKRAKAASSEVKPQPEPESAKDEDEATAIAAGVVGAAIAEDSQATNSASALVTDTAEAQPLIEQQSRRHGHRVVQATEDKVPRQKGNQYLMSEPPTNKGIAIILIMLGIFESCMFFAGIPALVLGFMSYNKGKAAHAAFTAGDDIKAEQEAEKARKFSTWGISAAVVLPIVILLIIGICPDSWFE